MITDMSKRFFILLISICVMTVILGTIQTLVEVNRAKQLALPQRRTSQANNVASTDLVPSSATTIANPASTNCGRVGGTLTIAKNPTGGEYGICTFTDNRQCEEWALLSGECPAGGVKITGYSTPAATFCVITGGNYTAKVATATKTQVGQDKNVLIEQGTCKLPKGTACDAGEYFNGTCPKLR